MCTACVNSTGTPAACAPSTSARTRTSYAGTLAFRAGALAHAARAAAQFSVKNCFIRGSTVRYVQLPKDEVDTDLLQDSTRIESKQQKKPTPATR